MFTPSDLVNRLDHALDIASSDRSKTERQRTIRGAIAWSYDLLDANEQHVLHALAVFDGGASLAGLVQVARTPSLGEEDVVEVLFRLVDASLVKVEDPDSGETRFHLLETIQRFALDKALERGQFDHLTIRHSQYHYDLAREQHGAKRSPDYALKRAVFLAELPTSARCLRGAHRIRHPEYYGDQDVPASHVHALLCQLALDFRRWTEAIGWAKACEALPDPEAAGLARTQTVHGFLSRFVESSNQSEPLARVALATASRAQVGEPQPPWVNLDDSTFLALEVMAQEASNAGDFDRAHQVCQELSHSARHCRHTTAPRLCSRAATSPRTKETFQRRTGSPSPRASSAPTARPLTISKDSMLWVLGMADLEIQLGNRAVATDRIAQHLDTAFAADPQSIYLLGVTLAIGVGPDYPRESAQLLPAAEQYRRAEGVLMGQAPRTDRARHGADPRTPLAVRVAAQLRARSCKGRDRPHAPCRRPTTPAT